MAFITDNNVRVILAQDVSMAADFATIPHDVTVFDMGAIQAVWTGANNTNAQIIPEASVDGENWCSIYPDANIKKVDSPAGCLMYLIDSLSWKFQRIRFVKNSNSAGTITLYSFVKRRRSNNP